MKTRFLFDSLGTTGPYDLAFVWSMPAESLLATNPTAYYNEMRSIGKMDRGGIGACAYCGTGIRDHFVLIDAAGLRFSVGCECVKKIDKTLADKLKSAKQKLEREKRDMKKAAAYQKLLDEQRQKNGGLTDSEVLCKLEDEKRERFCKEHEELFAAAKATGMAMALSIVETCTKYMTISQRQREVLERVIREHALIKASDNTYIGKVGEKREFVLETLHVINMGAYCYGADATLMVIMRCQETGNDVVAFTSSTCLPRKGEVGKISATVKQHKDYKGRCQTVICRPKKVG